MRINIEYKKRFTPILIYFLLITTILISCTKRTYKEVEPNNAFSQANSVEINSKIEGLINTRDDIDFYKIEVTNPEVVDIQISPLKGINHAFKIWGYDDGLKLLKHVDDLRKSSPERICNFYFNKGIYYITVLYGEKDKPKSNSKNIYKLSLTGRSWNNEEREVNDNITQASFFEIGSEILGYFSPSYNRMNYHEKYPLREEDWYYLNVELNEERPILLDIKLSGVPQVNSILYLFSHQREEIGYSDLNGIGQGELIKEAGITIPGNYYIMVTSNFEVNNDIPYRLLATSRDYDYTSEIEPNNRIEQANTIVENYIEGRVFPVGDLDYYLYNSSIEQELYRIEVLPPDNLDIKVEIFKNENKNLFEIDNYGKGKEEIIPNAILGGDFYIKVLAKRGELDQDYMYKLSITSTPFLEGSELEPNDEKKSASMVKSNTISGYISKKGDIDYYYLEYTGRVKKHFTIKGVKNSELKISITDPLGYIIKTEKIISDESKSLTEMVDIKGYIVVESIIENYDEPYTIEIGDK